ncbi:MAG: hypothetical protein P1P93_10600 [Gammaproteobacteria bacterium]|nr:hypothetical protein [Gammaproteobacteria bacterium]
MATRMLFEQALLAEASYADFSNVDNEENYLAALRDNGFSATQAEEFVDEWVIVAHQPEEKGDRFILVD